MGDEHVSAEARFRLLFDSHQETVMSYALRRAGTPADAADVLAETFVVAWRRLPDVPAGDEVPWLLGVARMALRNVERGNLRRHRLAARLREQVDACAPSDGGPLAPGELGAAMATLSAGDRELLQLVGWEGLTPAALAVTLGISGEAARARLSRARSRLRAALAGLSHDAPAGHLSVGGQRPAARDRRR